MCKSTLWLAWENLGRKVDSSPRESEAWVCSCKIVTTLGLTESHKGTTKISNWGHLGPEWQHASLFLDIERGRLWTIKGQGENCQSLFAETWRGMPVRSWLRGEQLYPNSGIEHCLGRDLESEDWGSGQFSTWDSRRPLPLSGPRLLLCGPYIVGVRIKWENVNVLSVVNCHVHTRYFYFF